MKFEQRYEGYFISSEGFVVGKRGSILKPSITGKMGYSSVALRIDGVSIHSLVHRLVYEAYKGEIPKGLVIDHIDGDTTNNHIDNLQAITQVENCWKGSYAKLSTEDVLGIRKLLEEGKLLQREIASLFGVTRSAICDIKKKKRWGKLQEEA